MAKRSLASGSRRRLSQSGPIYCESNIQRPIEYSELLPDAPRALVNMVQHPNPFHGRYLLYRLLSDRNMRPAWKELDKHLFIGWTKTTGPRKLDEDAKLVHRATWYPRIWREIFDAVRRSPVQLQSRKKKRDHFMEIGSRTKQLSKAIINGPLDRLAYDFFPSDVATFVFKSPKWPVLETDGRFALANRKLHPWPSLTDLLDEVERRAHILAARAMTEHRFVERETFDKRSNYFIRRLTQYFRSYLHGPMHGTVARIAAVTLTLADFQLYERVQNHELQIDIEFVKRALRHSKSARGGA